MFIILIIVSLFPVLLMCMYIFESRVFSYKETIASGTEAAARSGYAAVCAMPNLSPVPEDAATLAQELDIIERDAVIDVLPYGAITRGERGAELAEMAAMAPHVCGFSDDGHGVQSPELMRAAMLEAKRLGKPIAAHCEDNSLLRGGYIHDGDYARAHGHRGICSESEWGPIARDAELVRETGCAYHVCHISTRESAEVIRRAKAEGLDISCETGPHYLLLSDADLEEDGRFKMNPPLRSEADRRALVDALLDGTIDMIATDHAPHSAEEKSRGLEGSAFGITGLETAFPVLWTGLVEPGILSRERLIELMSTAPARRFGIESGIEVGEGCKPRRVRHQDQLYDRPRRLRLEGQKPRPSRAGRCAGAAYSTSARAGRCGALEKSDVPA